MQLRMSAHAPEKESGAASGKRGSALRVITIASKSDGYLDGQPDSPVFSPGGRRASRFLNYQKAQENAEGEPVDDSPPSPSRKPRTSTGRVSITVQDDRDNDRFFQDEPKPRHSVQFAQPRVSLKAPGSPSQSPQTGKKEKMVTPYDSTLMRRLATEFPKLYASEGQPMGFIPCLNMLDCTWQDSIVFDTAFEPHITLDEMFQEEHHTRRMSGPRSHGSMFQAMDLHMKRMSRASTSFSADSPIRTLGDDEDSDGGASVISSDDDEPCEIPRWLADQSRQDDDGSSSGFSESESSEESS